MVDIAALNRALPVSQLTPASLADLLGLDGTDKDEGSRSSFLFLEPPNGEQMPYMSPWAALGVLFEYSGNSGREVFAQATQIYESMKKDLAPSLWMTAYHPYGEAPNEFLSVTQFLKYLRSHAIETPEGKPLNCPEVLDWIEKAAELVSTLPLIEGAKDDKNNWSLRNPPAKSPTGWMIELVDAPPWVQKGDKDGGERFKLWLQTIKPQTQKLQEALGQSVMKEGFKGDYGQKGIAMHRFILLHWLCTYAPASKFVRHLLALSSARDVEDLKAALLDAKNYSQPFDVHAFGKKTVISTCEIEYQRAQTQKGVGIMFMSERARAVAKALIAERMNEHIVLITDEKLVPVVWYEELSRCCRSVRLCFIEDANRIDLSERPLDALAWIEELLLVGDWRIENLSSILNLPIEMQELYPMAIYLGASIIYYNLERMPHYSLELFYDEEEVNQELKALKRKRKALNESINFIELVRDPHGTGVRLANGEHLNFEQIQIPFKLVKRIVAWQRQGGFLDKGSSDQDAQQELHRLEGEEIAQKLRKSLGPNIEVKYDYARALAHPGE